MSVTLIVISAITIFLVLIWLAIAKNQRPQGMPPGPLSLPLIGNLHQIGFEPWKSFVAMGNKYGGIFSIDFGSFRSVVITDLKLLKQCLNDPALAGRPKFKIFLERSEVGATYCRGIITSELQHWTEQRRFVLKNLRDFGFGKSSMEGIIQDEIQEFLDGLRKRSGIPVSTSGLFNAAVVNSLWKICSSSRTPQDDPKLTKIYEGLIEAISAASPICVFFPKLAEMFPRMTGYSSLLGGHQVLNKFITEEYNNHKATFISGQPRDLTDVLIEEVAVTTDPKSSFYKHEGELSVIKSLEDLFLGGSETTSTTLTWLCLYMALFPEIQEKMFEEISKVVGPAKMVELSDRPKMPYTDCVIMEVLRIVAIFPLSIMHSATEDVAIAGFRIPKDTIVFPNLWKILHDPQLWEKPEEFWPERFLLPNGTTNKSHEAFIPFSFGKRVCIGERLAKDELFLFTTSVFQNFRVTTNPNRPKPSLKPAPTMLLGPKPHELIFYER